MEEKKFGYIYLTTNLVNGFIYYGQHKKDHFDTKYYGTGKTLLKALKKYGKENFKCELIEWCYSLEELNEREQYWIKKTNSNDRHIGYNITEGGGGTIGYHHSEEIKEKISENNGRYWKGKSLHPNTIEGHKKYFETHPGTRTGSHCPEEIKEKIRQSCLGRECPMKGKKHSEASKKKMHDSHIGIKTGTRHNPTTEEKKKIGNSLSEYYEKNIFAGERFSDDTKKKLSETAKNRTIINNGIINKSVKRDSLEEWIKNGWKLGRINQSPTSESRIRITNGIVEKNVKRKFLKRYLENGWFVGTLKSYLKKEGNI